MLRTRLYADPHNLFLHDLILDSCRRHLGKTALVDASCGRRFTYGEYGETVESVARGLIAAGVKPGDVITIYLYAAKNANPVGRLQKIVLADGTELHDTVLGGDAGGKTRYDPNSGK